MHIFYTPGIEGNEYTFTEQESKHCIRVLRLKTGEQVNLVDGEGGFYNAEIIDDNPKKCKVAISQTIKEYGKRDYSITIAIAPTKNNDRLEWFLEKATEIGIDRIIPFVSSQSERKVIKPERLLKIINSAMKQSIQAYMPKLENLVKFDDLMTMNLSKNKYIAHCFDEDKKLFKDVLCKGEDVTILIGPEGDFTIEEVNNAMDVGYIPVSLGENRLRTETAGIVAVHTVALINQ